MARLIRQAVYPDRRHPPACIVNGKIVGVLFPGS